MVTMVALQLSKSRGKNADGSSNLHRLRADPLVDFDMVKLHQLADFHVRDLPLADEFIDRVRTHAEIGRHLVDAHQARCDGGAGCIITRSSPSASRDPQWRDCVDDLEFHLD